MNLQITGSNFFSGVTTVEFDPDGPGGVGATPLTTSSITNTQIQATPNGPADHREYGHRDGAKSLSRWRFGVCELHDQQPGARCGEPEPNEHQRGRHSLHAHGEWLQSH
ncbi:MAG: hypothetical protein R3C29_03535 [Dehalococcoidia bacterium]